MMIRRIIMPTERKIEIFSAGCACCEDTISKIKDIACPDCEIAVLNMNEAEVAQRAKALGIHSVPAVVIDGKLASCCVGRGPDGTVLRQEGLGQTPT
jgi:hypothetical protein